MTRLLSVERERVYGHRLYFMQIFIDPQRYRGTLLPHGELGGYGTDDLPRQERLEQKPTRFKRRGSRASFTCPAHQ